MKTLHKLFFKDYIKVWATMLFIAYLVPLIAKLSGVTSGILVFFYTTFILIAPLAQAWCHKKDFTNNLSWLINCHFNRKELMRFYFKISLIKFSLFLLFYVLYFVPIVMTDLFIKKKIIIQKVLTRVDYSDGFSFILFVCAILYLFFIVPIFNANSEQVKNDHIRSRATNPLTLSAFNPFKFSQLNSLDKKRVFVLYFVLFFNSYFFISEHFSSLFYIVFICMGAFYLIPIVSNRCFKFLTKKAEIQIGSCLSIFIFILFAVNFHLTVNQLNDSNIHKHKLSALKVLEGLYTPSEKVIKDILRKESESENMKYLGSYIGKFDINIEQVISYHMSEEGFTDFLGMYFVNNDYVSLKDAFDHMEKYQNVNRLSKKSKLDLVLYFSRVKQSKQMIYSLMKSDDITLQYLSFNLAKRHLYRRDFNIYLSQYKDSFNPEMLKFKSVKRSVASYNRESNYQTSRDETTDNILLDYNKL